MAWQPPGVQPIGQAKVAARFKAGVDMQGHELDWKRQTPLILDQDLQQDPAVLAAGKGYTQAGTGPEHASAVHQLPSLANTRLLGICQFVFLGQSLLLTDKNGELTYKRWGLIQ
jgi:hypothetical protein